MSIVLVLRVFIPFGLGYFLASTFRSINTVISTDLVRALSLSASELGFAGSAFFLSATLFQISYGILLDRYDPRRIYSSFLLLCALGAMIVSVSQEIVLLSIGRALIATWHYRKCSYFVQNIFNVVSKRTIAYGKWIGIGC